MTGPHLVYFADPMCSWCWGFSPVIEAIRRRFGDALPVRLVLGGLRPGNTNVMTASDRAEIRAHWEHVREASGQPFDFSFFEREGFVYDTEPASRAVVVFRQQGMTSGLAALARIQHAFYAENRDVTAAKVLTDLAMELGMDELGFKTLFNDAAVAAETMQDFALAQQAGIRGFPTLIAGTGDQRGYALVTNGFQRADRLIPALTAWLEKL
ncbi:DsbA family protein [Acidocella facilis]|uniref:DsbA family protein n=1 Tax=Acidocella facilis TaxID=525 RepID=UPI001F1DE335|nr:DsbA family protein [Acidocella facilis]